MNEGTATGTEKLPRFVNDLLTACPAAGDGVNLWLFKVARYLHHFRTPGEIENLLAAACHGCGRTVTASEIKRAVRNSAAHACDPGQASTVENTPLWPAFSSAARAKAVGSGGDLFALSNGSPSPVTETEAITDALFPGNPLLCCGKSKSKFATRHRETWRGALAACQFIVPSPMSKRVGLTAEGTKSEHCLDNTGPRRFLVIEQDAGTIDEQAAFLLHLKELAPLALAVHSGGKSVHGWFYCRGQDEAHLKEFMRYCVERGADRATWQRSQFVRMPGGKRDNGAVQAVCYFAPLTTLEP